MAAHLMSVRVMAWVWEHSPASGTDLLVLLAVADFAHDDGAAWPAVATLAAKSRCSERTAQRSIRSLIEMGALRVEEGGGRGATHHYWIIMEAGQRCQPDTDSEEVKGDNLSGVTDGKGDTRDAERVTPVTGKGDTRVTQTIKNHQGNRTDSLRSSVSKINRADVERLCEHLADQIEDNGCKRPKITQDWRDAARLMIDKDNRTEAQVTAAIDWATSDEFWRTNVLSMTTLRRQYERLRLAAQRARSVAGMTNGRRTSTADDRVAQALAVGRELQTLADAGQLDQDRRRRIEGGTV